MPRPSSRALRTAPGLPPLPPPPSWRTYFPPRQLAAPPDKMCREFPGRVLLASPDLCDEFVRALHLRENEVVLEYNPGPGQLTRSLLSGGSKEARAWSHERLAEAQAIPSSQEVSESDESSASGASPESEKRAKRDPSSRSNTWPPWAKETPADTGSRTAGRPSSPQAGADDSTARPRLVVGIEPSAALLNSGFNTPAEKGTYANASAGPSGAGSALQARGLTSAQMKAHVAAEREMQASASSAEPVEQPTLPVTPSPYDPRLLMSHSTAYRWPVLPRLLSHPLITPHLPVYDETKTTLEGRTRRPWAADPPPITLVAHIPDAVNGEQMTSQWVGSAVGKADERNWIWQWGRIRMALIIGKGLYDRMTALPGEMINTKLSIMTRALFDLTPLPPYHHVPNVDRASKFTEGRPIRASASQYYANKWGGLDSSKSGSNRSAKLKADTNVGEVVHPWDHYGRTATVQADFYPMLARRGQAAEVHNVAPLPRPRLLGILLEPKKESYVRLEQKEAWDYVLRNCFVTPASPLRESMKNLGFNGEGLADKVADPSNKYRGQAVDPMKTVRDLDVAEWARMVDVFDRWPFRPENLLIAAGSVSEDLTREIGQD